jgi:hypothetical protein
MFALMAYQMKPYLIIGAAILGGALLIALPRSHGWLIYNEVSHYFDYTLPHDLDHFAVATLDAAITAVLIEVEGWQEEGFDAEGKRLGVDPGFYSPYDPRALGGHALLPPCGFVSGRQAQCP